jgi:hypothetical protein
MNLGAGITVRNWQRAFRILETRIGLKGGNVTSFRNPDAQLFLLTLGQKVSIQPLPKLPRFYADNVILSRIVVGTSAKYLNANLLLMDFVSSVGKGFFTNVKKKFAKPR